MNFLRVWRIYAFWPYPLSSPVKNRTYKNHLDKILSYVRISKSDADFYIESANFGNFFLCASKAETERFLQISFEADKIMRVIKIILSLTISFIILFIVLYLGKQ